MLLQKLLFLILSSLIHLGLILVYCEREGSSFFPLHVDISVPHIRGRPQLISLYTVEKESFSLRNQKSKMDAISPLLSARIGIYRQRCQLIDDEKLWQVWNNELKPSVVGNSRSMVPPNHHVKILRSTYGIYSRFEK